MKVPYDLFLSPKMRFALTNLDNGLFVEKNFWTAEYSLADAFRDVETVARVASVKGIRNAAATIIEGDPPKALGFVWLTEPGQTVPSANASFEVQP